MAFDEFKDSPLSGVGSENFAEDYVRERNSDEEPLIRTTSPCGFSPRPAWWGGALHRLSGRGSDWRGRTRLRSSDPLGRGVGGLAAVVFVYWFAHSTGDWFWAFPALSAPVFAWLGLGMRVGADRGLRQAPTWAADWERPAAVAAGVVVVFATLSLALPWTAAVDTKKAAETWGAAPTLPTTASIGPPISTFSAPILTWWKERLPRGSISPGACGSHSTGRWTGIPTTGTRRWSWRRSTRSRATGNPPWNGYSG